MTTKATPTTPGTLIPVLPLRDVVVYPHMVIPLFVGREKSIKALEYAVSGSKQVMLTAQKEAAQDVPKQEEIYKVGTISNILQMLKLPDGTVKVLVEGTERGKIVEFEHEDPFFLAKVEPLKSEVKEGNELEGLLRSLLSQFDQYVKLDKKFSSEIIVSLSGIDDPVRLADTIAAHMPLKIADKQKILELVNFKKRALTLLHMMEVETDLMQVEKRISGDVERRIKKNQREYYLHEKLKAIQKELGELGEDATKPNEMKELQDKIDKAGIPLEAKEKIVAEVKKLNLMPPLSAEATVLRNYIDWVLAVPWKKRSKIRKDLSRAEAIHF